MAAVVEGFRWALTGGNEFPLHMLLVSGGMALVVLVSGLYWFRREEVIFADVV